MPNNNEQPDAGMRERAMELIEELRLECYGGTASNVLEGDYGSWADWQAVLMRFAAAESARAVEAAVKVERERLAEEVQLVIDSNDWELYLPQLQTQLANNWTAEQAAEYFVDEQLRTADPRTGVVEGEK